MLKYNCQLAGHGSSLPPEIDPMTEVHREYLECSPYYPSKPDRHSENDLPEQISRVWGQGRAGLGMDNVPLLDHLQTGPFSRNDCPRPTTAEKQADEPICS